VRAELQLILLERLSRTMTQRILIDFASILADEPQHLVTDELPGFVQLVLERLLAA